ncbi:uncharacterized protein [Narcine bancroftii]|uniref:uncharacterized protein n=1 Tax=Narcine bancroftii TaxID=1343680 RepID=UPI003831C225
MRKESGDVSEAELLDGVQNLLGNINQPLSNVRFLETEILQVPEHQFNNCSMEDMFLVRNYQAHGGGQGTQIMQSRLNQSMGRSNQVQSGGRSNQMHPEGVSNQMQATSQGMHQMQNGTQVNRQPMFHQSWRNGQNIASSGGSTAGTGLLMVMSPPYMWGTSNLSVLLSGALNTSIDCEGSFQVSDTTSRSTLTTTPLRVSFPVSFPQIKHSSDTEAE